MLSQHFAMSISLASCQILNWSHTSEIAGWHVKELRLNKLWDTEQSSQYTMDVHPVFTQRHVPSNLVAKQPDEVPVSAGHTGFFHQFGETLSSRARALV